MPIANQFTLFYRNEITSKYLNLPNASFIIDL